MADKFLTYKLPCCIKWCIPWTTDMISLSQVTICPEL